MVDTARRSGLVIRVLNARLIKIANAITAHPKIRKSPDSGGLPILRVRIRTKRRVTVPFKKRRGTRPCTNSAAHASAPVDPATAEADPIGPDCAIAFKVAWGTTDLAPVVDATTPSVTGRK